MFPALMSNSTSLSEEGTSVGLNLNPNPVVSTICAQKIKKKRSLPGNPDPDAEVIALSPKTLLATNRFVCEICNKGFQRDQNLQLHRRGHNLPWKLKQRNSKEIKKRAYVCPEPTCVHHHPSRALGDLTGIKKHYCRKHGEKKWKCEKCSKIYAVQSDWKAHSKTCGTREYRCDCGTLFSRKDSFITHRAFCDALAEESARLSANPTTTTTNPNSSSALFTYPSHISLSPWDPPQNPNPNPVKLESLPFHIPPPPSLPFFQPTTNPAPLISSPFPLLQPTSSAALSATALLQKAATVGATATTHQPSSHHVLTQPQHGQLNSRMSGVAEFGHVDSLSDISPEYQLSGFSSGNLATWHKSDRLTRDFLGLRGPQHEIKGNSGNVNVSISARELLTYAGGAHQFPLPAYHRDQSTSSFLRPQGLGFAEPAAAASSQAWEHC